MKHLIVGVVFLICFTNAQNIWRFIPATPRSNTYGCTGGFTGRTCGNCSALVVCNSDNSVQFESLCIDINPKTPYCNLNTQECSSDNTCIDTTNTMDCQYTGYFPDPMSCFNYFICAENSGKADRYTCPSGSKYDHSKKACTTVAACVTYSVDAPGLCAKKPFQYLAIASDPSSYVICPPTNTNTVTLRTCKSSLEKIDVKSGKCEFSCPNAGFYPHTEENKFYVCSAAGSKPIEDSCISPAKFDKTKNMCVKPPTQGGS